MNQTGEFYRNGRVTLVNMSTYDILEADEHETVCRLIEAIAKRNPNHKIKITFEVKETVQ